MKLFVINGVSKPHKTSSPSYFFSNRPWNVSLPIRNM